MSRYDDPENRQALMAFYGVVIGGLAALFGAIWVIDWLFVS